MFVINNIKTTIAVLDLIKSNYEEGTPLYHCLVEHSLQVAELSLEIAERHPELYLDKTFLYEAAMLHDIGVIYTDAPAIYCTGSEPYIRHGVLGAELLRKEGLEAHARVAERHTGTGLTKEEIIARDLPLPHCNFEPETLEEQVICFSDLFFSKTKLGQKHSLERVEESLSKFGPDSVEKFHRWKVMFL